MIRYGESSATVSAVFDNIAENTLNVMQEYGLEIDEDELILRRIMTVEGKNTCYSKNRIYPVFCIYLCILYTVDLAYSLNLEEILRRICLLRAQRRRR